MPKPAYPHLFRPRRLQRLWLKNRLTMAPLYLGYAGEGGTVSPLMLEHYREMARSGVALVVVENASIAPGGSGAPRTLRCDHDRYLPGLTRLAEVFRAAKTRSALQINHAGRFAGGPQTVSASAVPAFGRTPQALSKKEITAVQKQFVRSAQRARQAGFDLVELHGGTGYLLAQFVSPRTNRRSDEYGGSLANRLRFPLEVVQRVKEAVGDFPVGYRFLADEWLPDGLGLMESAVLARELARLGVAYLSVMGGTYESFGRPEVVQRSRRPCYMVDLARRIKKAADVPVIAAGRISTPRLAESILAKGYADFIGLARMLWADPEWPRKARAGQDAAIRKCRSRCDACMELVMRGAPAFCPHWPKEYRAARQALFQ